MRVRLMLTCLGDTFFGPVGISAVRVLEAFGCEVEFPEKQTCCGQPCFNSGDWSSARELAARTLDIFGDDLPIVTPSTSCAAMLAHGYRQLLPHRERWPEVFELSQFLARGTGNGELGPTIRFAPPAFKARSTRVVIHVGCHGRVIGVHDQPGYLMKMIPGLELTKVENEEQCCGFGGSFSVGLPTVSAGIGRAKLETLVAEKPDVIASTDPGCMMHLAGLAGRQVPVRHFAEILAEALP